MTTATRSTRTRRPEMTPEEAQRFDRQSVASFAQVVASLQCECEPYEDVFTFRRWQAQGFHVRKGEHGVKFLSFVPVDGRQSADGTEHEPYLMPRTLVVFCRCQVAND